MSIPLFGFSRAWIALLFLGSGVGGGIGFAATAPAPVEPMAESGTAAPADLEFSGYLRSDRGLRFILSQPERLAVSDWLAPGEAFGGYRVESFDAARETLIVRKGDAFFRLPLKGAKTTALAPAPAVAVPPGDQKIVVRADGFLVGGELLDLRGLDARLKSFDTPTSDARLKLVVHIGATPEEAAQIAAHMWAVRGMLRTLTGALFGRLSMEVVSPDAPR